VATAFGVLAALSWPAALVAGAVWIGVFRSRRLASLASLAAAVAFPLGVAAVEPWRSPETYVAVQLVAVLATAVIVVRHAENIRRLLRGEELAPGRGGGP
jgi:glycerol-3-phosphate acyltransferase PlsY